MTRQKMAPSKLTDDALDDVSGGGFTMFKAEGKPLKAKSSVTLLLDESDAVLGKRTEVKDSHDRYANIEMSHLLGKTCNPD